MSGAYGDWVLVALLFGLTVASLAYVAYRGRRDTRDRKEKDGGKAGAGPPLSGASPS